MTDTSMYPIRTQADLEAHWRARIQPLGWSERRVWFWLIDRDGHPVQTVQEIAQIPDLLHPRMVQNLVAIWEALTTHVEPESSVAVMLARPGVGGPSAVDRAQAEAVYTAARAVDLRLEVIHLATDEDVWPIPMDSAMNRSA